MVATHAAPLSGGLPPSLTPPSPDTLEWCRAFLGPSGPVDSEPVLWALLWPKGRPRDGTSRRGRPHGALHLYGTPCTLWERLARANALGWGVYAVLHTMELALTDRGQPKRAPEQVRRWNGWWVDCDIPESVEELLRVQPSIRPTMTVETSPGRWQALWRTSQPVTTAAHARSLASPLGTMARALRGDPSVTDPARLLRVPGFLNTKREEPHLVRIVTHEPGVSYSYEALTSYFPPSARGSPPPTATNLDTGALADGGFLLAQLKERLAAEPALVDLRAELTASALTTMPPLVFNAGHSDADVLRAAARMRDLGWTEPREIEDALAYWFNTATTLDGLPNTDLGNVEFLRAKVRNALRYARGEPGAVLLMEAATRDAMASAETETPTPGGTDENPLDEGDPDAPAVTPPPTTPTDPRQPTAPAPAVTPPTTPPIPVASEEELAAWILRWRLTPPTPGSLPPVADGALLRVYDPAAGAWTPLSEVALLGVIRERSDQPAVHRGSRDIIRRLTLNNRSVHAIASALRERATIPDFFDQAPPGASFAGDFCNVTSAGLALTPATPDHRSRVTFRFPWPDGAPTTLDDPDAQPEDSGGVEWLTAHAPRFAAFLVASIGVERPLADVTGIIRTLQEFTGAAITGLAPRFERALLIHGTGSNGKSTFLAILRALFHPDDIAAVPIRKWDDPRFVIKLAGRRLNMIPDDWGNETIDETALKSIISSTDPVTARDVYESAVTFLPTAGHVMVCNNLPRTRDQSDGFWRRWLPVEFLGAFGGDGQPVKDTEILKKILPAEMPQIVAWALLGAARLLERGDYLLAPATLGALAKWRTEADTALDFLSKVCTVVHDAKGVRPEELFNTYREWCAATGHLPMSARQLAVRLRRHLARGSKRTSTGRMWPLVIRPANEWDWD